MIAVLLSLFCAYPALGEPLCCFSDVASGCCAPTPAPVPPPCCCCDDEAAPNAPTEMPEECPCEWDQAATDHYLAPVAQTDVGASLVLDWVDRAWDLRAPAPEFRPMVRHASPPAASPPLALLGCFRL